MDEVAIEINDAKKGQEFLPHENHRNAWSGKYKRCYQRGSFLCIEAVGIAGPDLLRQSGIAVRVVILVVVFAADQTLKGVSVVAPADDAGERGHATRGVVR